MAIKEMKGMQWLFALAKVVVAASLITWLVRSGKFDLASLQKIKDPVVWLTGLILFLFSFLANCKRWQIFLSFENVNESFRKILSISLIGVFFNFFIPGGVGGDVVKAGYLVKENPKKKWFVGWSALIDRIFGLISLLFISSLTGLFFYKEVNLELQNYIFSLSIIVLLGVAVGVAALILVPLEQVDKLFPKDNFLKKLLHTPFYFFKTPKRVIAPFLLSLLSQFFNIATFIAFGYLTGFPSPWWHYTLLVPIGMLSVILPIAPAGVGVGQTAFYYLFENIAGSGEFGALVITFVQLTQLMVGGLGGIMFILYNKKQKP